jgi:enamine deaminase RidA (YjgF/YER057c/UK114 family)
VVNVIRRILIFWLAVALLTPLAIEAQKKKKTEEELTQTLPVLLEPPQALVVETRKFSFVTTPLSNKGLFTQQMRDALKGLLQNARGAQVVKLRAFVAGGGDLRRVSSVVGEVFADKKFAMPVISTVQVGGLPAAGAEVQLEAVLQQKQNVAEHGLAFLSARWVKAEAGQARMPALVQRSLGSLRQSLEAAGTGANEVLRVSCFVTTLEDALDVQALMASTFPHAAASVVSTQRAPSEAGAACEAVAALRKDSGPIEFIGSEDGSSQVVLIGAPRLVVTGSQLAFQYSEPDARLAFERLNRTLEANGSSLQNAVVLNAYPLSMQLAAQVRKVRMEFIDARRAPAGTILPFEGLPGLESAFSLEAIAVPAADSGKF